jgi:hypothetical protein
MTTSLSDIGLTFADGSVQSFAMGRNRIINGNFGINQRVYVSGAAVGAGLYGHDRWKMAASGDTYTFSTTANVTTITIPAGKVLQQVIEGLNLETGTYTLSWVGTAQGKIGAGSYGASGITDSITGGTNTTIEFGPGTVSKVQLEFGSVASAFEQRPYGLELILCQRYYETTYNAGTPPGSANYNGAIAGPTCNGNMGAVTLYFTFKVQKRTSPTVFFWGPQTGTLGLMNDAGGNPSGATLSVIGQFGVGIYNSGMALTANSTVYAQFAAVSEL